MVSRCPRRTKLSRALGRSPPCGRCFTFSIRGSSPLASTCNVAYRPERKASKALAICACSHSPWSARAVYTNDDESRQNGHACAAGVA